MSTDTRAMVASTTAGSATGDGLQQLLIRVGVATVVLLHSLGRLGIGPRAGIDIAGFGRWLSTLGLPMPQVLAWVVTIVELIGGICLLVGVLSSLAAAGVSATAFGALWIAHWPAGFRAEGAQIELTGLLVVAALSVLLDGAGPFSLEQALFGEEVSRPERLADRLRERRT